MLEAALKALFHTSSHTLGSSEERRDGEWWHQCGMCYLETPCRFQWEEIISSYMDHSFFPADTLTSPPRQSTLALEVFHLKTSCFCGVHTEGLHSLTPLHTPQTPKHQYVDFLPHCPPWQPCLLSSKQLHLQTPQSKRRHANVQPTFRSQAKCL